MKNLGLSVIAGIGAFLAIGLLSFFDSTMSDVALLMAPFGATAVLVFGVPESPLAQPKNVIFGHLITAFVGVFFTQHIGVSPLTLTLALATGIAVSLMLVTKTTHPPAGANPLLIMLSGRMGFPYYSCFSGSCSYCASRKEHARVAQAMGKKLKC